MKYLILLSILILGCSNDDKLRDNFYSASSIQIRAERKELINVLNYIEEKKTDRRVLTTVLFETTKDWLTKNGYKVESAPTNPNLYYIRW